ncbi:Formyltransferase [Panaeolus papilionaceus]|nr:Formyltransferase [Panaeolus papilionaceus]
MGRDEFSCGVLTQLHKHKDVWQDIVIATQPDTKVGRRGSQLSISPLKTLGETLGLSVHTIPHRKPDFRTWKLPPPFSEFVPTDASQTPPPEDIVITASFGRILSKGHLEMFAKDRRLNVHPSLLPDYRGPAPLQRALLDGRHKTGVCIIEMLKKSEGIDAGRIWEREEAVINADDTFVTLRDRLAVQGGDLLAKSLRNMIKGSATCLPQASAENAPSASFITATDALIDFQRHAARDIIRMHRAISHQKPVFTYTPNGAEVQFHDICELTGLTSGEQAMGKLPDQQPGSAVYNNPTKSVLVRCAGGSVLGVNSLQSEGKKQLNAQQWWNGTKEGKEGRVMVFGSQMCSKL